MFEVSWYDKDNVTCASKMLVLRVNNIRSVVLHKTGTLWHLLEMQNSIFSMTWNWANIEEIRLKLKWPCMANLLPKPIHHKMSWYYQTWHFNALKDAHPKSGNGTYKISIFSTGSWIFATGIMIIDDKIVSVHIYINLSTRCYQLIWYYSHKHIHNWIHAPHSILVQSILAIPDFRGTT